MDQNNIVAINNYENESSEEVYDKNLVVGNRQTRADPCLSTQEEG